MVPAGPILPAWYPMNTSPLPVVRLAPALLPTSSEPPPPFNGLPAPSPMEITWFPASPLKSVAPLSRSGVQQLEYCHSLESSDFGLDWRQRSMATITVNGVKREVQAPGDTPLLYVLRNDLLLTGPQFGCGLAQCGACSVLIDGKEVRSCITALSDVGPDQEITTLEGLPARWAKQKGLSAEEAKTTLHPVQQAWIEEQTPQCGFCQNGMMIKATELSGRQSESDSGADQSGLHHVRQYPRFCAAAERTRRSLNPCSMLPRSWREGGKRWRPREPSRSMCLARRSPGASS